MTNGQSQDQLEMVTTEGLPQDIAQAFQFVDSIVAKAPMVRAELEAYSKAMGKLIQRFKLMDKACHSQPGTRENPTDFPKPVGVGVTETEGVKVGTTN